MTKILTKRYPTRRFIGPSALFSLTLWSIIEKIQESSPELQQNSWYLDEGVLVGSNDDLIRSWNFLCELGPDPGLHVRVDKCELWSSVELDRLKIRTKLNDISGLGVLGAALGAPEFVCKKINERIGKIRVLCQKMNYPADLNCALGIVRQSIGVLKMVYFVRCQTPTSTVIKSLKEFDTNHQQNLRISLKLIFQKKPGLKQHYT